MKILHEHEHSLYDELICHTPYAIASVAFSIALVSFLSYLSLVVNGNAMLVMGASSILFHAFHFMHIIFATTGTMITAFRVCQNRIKALTVGVLLPPFFCMLSDSILPYMAGRVLGVAMHFHICFFSELWNVLPFLFVGLINGLVMSKHHKSQQMAFSLYSHFVHILVSSFASIFYLVSQGYVNWFREIGIVFLFLIGAVLIPCTLSDVVLPLLIVKKKKNGA